MVQHLEILLHLQLLELLNSQLTLVNGHEVDKAIEVFDLLVELVDSLLVFIDVLLDGGLRLEEALQGGLSHGHAVQLRLLGASVLLSLVLSLNGLVSSIDGIDHSFDVKDFSLEPDPGGIEGILLLIHGLLYLVLELGGEGVWASHDSQGAILTGEVVESNLFKLKEVLVELGLVLLGGFVGLGVLLELLLLFLSKNKINQAEMECQNIFLKYCLLSDL